MSGSHAVLTACFLFEQYVEVGTLLHHAATGVCKQASALGQVQIGQ